LKTFVFKLKYLIFLGRQSPPKNNSKALRKRLLNLRASPKRGSCWPHFASLPLCLRSAGALRTAPPFKCFHMPSGCKHGQIVIYRGKILPDFVGRDVHIALFLRLKYRLGGAMWTSHPTQIVAPNSNLAGQPV